jgi:hypothetical protein
MTVRSMPRVRNRVRSARPTADKLFQKPLSEWYAQWKAGKANSRGTTQTPSPLKSPPAASIGSA